MSDKPVECQWCMGTALTSLGFPQFLDEDGTLCAITGKPGVLSHAYDDAWWPCLKFGVEWHCNGVPSSVKPNTGDNARTCTSCPPRGDCDHDCGFCDDLHVSGFDCIHQGEGCKEPSSPRSGLDKTVTPPLAQMDWQQVVQNGGPPCFALLDDEVGWYCGRAERWDGHDGDHKYVSLAQALSEAREQGLLEAAEVAHAISGRETNTAKSVFAKDGAASQVSMVADAMAEVADEIEQAIRSRISKQKK